MTEVEELKRMVMTFRVSELVMLLGYAGRNKTGRKQELQARALDLAKSRVTSVTNKIRELYKTIQSQAGLTQAMPQGNAVPDRSVGYSSYPPSAMLQGRGSYMAPPGLFPEYSSRPGGGGGGGGSAAAHSSAHKVPTHPDVTFKVLPFYDVLAELIKPTSLAMSPVQGKGFSDASFVFTLTPQQADEVASNHDGRPGTKLEYPVQIQMRLCLLETSCPQEDHFPPNISVRVNNKPCQLPNPIMSTKPGVEPRRPPKPVNITPLCRISPVLPNSVHVSWGSELGRAYCVTVGLVRRLSSGDLLTRLRTRGAKNADFTRALIKEKLCEGYEDEIATTSLKCSLQCPLGKCRMQLPCRATTCQHLQCFDASLYIQMNERKPTWVCPVCDKPALYKHLVIDGYFAEVLRRTGNSCMDVTLHQDGSWREVSKEVKDKNQPKQQEVEEDSGPKVETLDEDSGSDDIKVTEEKEAAPEKKKKEPQCVDLTLSDSEDEAPPPPKKRLAAAAAPVSGSKQLSSEGSSSTDSSASNSLAALRNMSLAREVSSDAAAPPPYYPSVPRPASSPYMDPQWNSFLQPAMSAALSGGGWPGAAAAAAGGPPAAPPPAPGSPDIISLD